MELIELLALVALFALAALLALDALISFELGLAELVVPVELFDLQLLRARVKRATIARQKKRLRLIESSFQKWGELRESLLAFPGESYVLRSCQAGPRCGNAQENGADDYTQESDS